MKRAMFFAVAVSTASWGAWASAQAPKADAKADAPKPPAAGAAALAGEQEAVAKRYKEFETVLGRMSDLLKISDADRAALLSKAFSQSKRDLIGVQLAKLSEELRGGEFGKTLKNQESVREDMLALLDLLLSEDRARQLRERRERIEKYLKEVQRLSREQKGLRLQTERTENASGTRKLAQGQERLADETRKLAEKIKSDDTKAAANKAGSPKPGEGKPSEGNAKPSDGAPKPGDKSSKGQGESKPGEGKPGEGKGGKGGQGSPRGTEPGQDDPDGKQPPPQQQQQQGSEDTPGRKNIEAAQRAMEDAKRQLEELKRQGASENQDKAIKELEKAIAELEEILRQLREEERQQLLAALEMRFRKMLEMQRIVYDGTVAIDRTPIERRSRADEKSLNLAKREAEIAKEADQALLILQEDGTAVAFPEAVSQVKQDVLLVVALLTKADTGKFTQSVETDIIAALEEMIDALKKEMKKGKGECKCNGNGQPFLVDMLAELKMVRSMQKKVNQRTDRIGQLYSGVAALTEEIKKAVGELADKQHRIYGITRDIVQGKNK